MQGAGDLLGVALIIAIARGVTVLMDNGMISDSILYASASLVEGMDKGVFIVVMMSLFAGYFFLCSFFFRSCCAVYADYGTIG